MKETPRDLGGRKATLRMCCGVHGLQDGLTSAVYVLLPILGQALGLSYAQVGVVRAANVGAMSLLEFPSGLLAERLGERPLIVFGLACSGAGYVSLSLVGDFAGVLCALILTGLGTAFQHSLCSSLISNAFDASGRRVALGVYNSSGDLGKLLATGIMSALIGLGVAWQGVSAGYGGLALLGAAGLALAFRPFSSPAKGGDAPHAEGAVAMPAGGIRDRVGFLALTAIVFLDSAVQDGFLVFIAFLMIEKEVPAGLAAAAVVLTLSGGMLGKFACGILGQRLGVIRSLVLVECLSAMGILFVYLSPSLLSFCLLPLVGTVLQGSSSISYGTVGELVDGRRSSRGFAVVYSAASAAGVLSPVCFGLFADGFGVGPAMLAMAVTVLLPLPLCLVLGPALRRVHA